MANSVIPLTDTNTLWAETATVLGVSLTDSKMQASFFAGVIVGIESVETISRYASPLEEKVKLVRMMTQDAVIKLQNLAGNEPQTH